MPLAIISFSQQSSSHTYSVIRCKGIVGVIPVNQSNSHTCFQQLWNSPDHPDNQSQFPSVMGTQFLDWYSPDSVSQNYPESGHVLFALFSFLLLFYVFKTGILCVGLPTLGQNK